MQLLFFSDSYSKMSEDNDPGSPMAQDSQAGIITFHVKALKYLLFVSNYVTQYFSC